MLVADIIQSVRPDRARTDDQMIHERECRKACCHAEAAVRRVQEGDVHLKERRSQPEDEEGKGGKGVVLDPRPEYKGRQHLVLHEKDQSHDQENEDRPAIHQCNRHTHLAWKKRHRRLGNHCYDSLSQVIRFAKTMGVGFRVQVGRFRVVVAASLRIFMGRCPKEVFKKTEISEIRDLTSGV